MKYKFGLITITLTLVQLLVALEHQAYSQDLEIKGDTYEDSKLVTKDNLSIKGNSIMLKNSNIQCGNLKLEAKELKINNSKIQCDTLTITSGVDKILIKGKVNITCNRLIILSSLDEIHFINDWKSSSSFIIKAKQKDPIERKISLEGNKLSVEY